METIVPRPGPNCPENHPAAGGIPGGELPGRPRTDRVISILNAPSGPAFKLKRPPRSRPAETPSHSLKPAEMRLECSGTRFVNGGEKTGDQNRWPVRQQRANATRGGRDAVPGLLCFFARRCRPPPSLGFPNSSPSHRDNPTATVTRPGSAAAGRPRRRGRESQPRAISADVNRNGLVALTHPPGYTACCPPRAARAHRGIHATL